jgi:PAS domain S-box-containing protein
MSVNQALLLGILTGILGFLLYLRQKKATRTATAALQRDKELQVTLEHSLQERVAEAAQATQLYQLLAENASDMISTHSPSGVFEYATPTWGEYLGVLTLTGKSPLEFCHPVDGAEVMKNYALALKSAAHVTTAWRCRKANGGYGWVETTTRVVRDPENSRVKIFVCATRDISQRKQLEETLASQRRFLGAVLDSLSEGIIACDASGSVTLLNRSLRDGFGSVPAGTPIETFAETFQIFQPDGKTPLSPEDLPLRRVLNGEIVHDRELAITMPSGEQRRISINGRPVTDEERGSLGGVITVRDITDWKAAQEALAQSEARYRQLVEHAADAILIMDTEGRIVEANARACSLLGYDRNDLRELPLDSLIAPDEKGARPALPSLRKGDFVTSEYWILRGDGKRIPIEVSAGVLPSGQTQVIARDISDRKELERLKDQFVAVVSHELRTPLTSVRGALGLLASGRLAETPEKSQRMLDLAVESTDRLIRLINDILDMERIESGRITMERRWTDALAVVRQVIESLRPVATNGDVVLRVHGDSTEVWADVDRLNQTLTNLVGNAVKFSNPGSAVDVSVSRIGTDVLFEVRDEGRGIPEDKLEFIFNRFQQIDASDSREKGGTGLGLAISRSIVRQHGGKIWADSKPGKGSVFRFTLPLPAPFNAAPPQKASSGILVCDDDPVFLEYVRRMLEERGYNVTTALSGSEAIQRARQNPPEAILLDMIMPGMSGRETLEILRAGETTRDVPVIIVSSAFRDDQVKQVSDWLSKPVLEHSLVDALERALPSRGPHPSRILVVEDDAELADVLSTALEARGFNVKVVHRGLDALHEFELGGADVLLIDIGLPDMDGLAVLEKLRTRPLGSGVPAVVYTAADLDAEQRTRVREAGGEIATKARTSPEQLVDYIAKLLDLSTRKPART